MDTIVIAVQIGSTWLFYLTERYSLNQTVLRLPPGYQRPGDMATTMGVTKLDILMQSVERGALDIWLRMVMRDITRKDNGGREVRENLRLDIVNEEFTTG